MNGISALVRRDRKLAPLSALCHVRIQRESNHLQPGRISSLDIRSARTFLLGFLASRTGRNEYL